MSDSVQPHRRQPPWDSPGKNTGVGCRFLLQCMKVKIESEVIQSYPTLSDPMDCSLPGPSVHRIFQARVLEWVAIPFSGEFFTHAHFPQSSRTEREVSWKQLNKMLAEQCPLRHFTCGNSFSFSPLTNSPPLLLCT